MTKIAAASVLFGTISLIAFFSSDSLQIAFADNFLQQENQKRKAEPLEEKVPVADVLKESLTSDDSEVLGVKFKATAYCLRGKTASGKMVRKGIIAADPKVLPLGTSITILQGPYAGDYLVADTGGRIKGNKIDIWMASCAEAIRFGNRSVLLRIPEKRDS